MTRYLRDKSNLKAKDSIVDRDQDYQNQTINAEAFAQPSLIEKIQNLNDKEKIVYGVFSLICLITLLLCCFCMIFICKRVVFKRRVNPDHQDKNKDSNFENDGLNIAERPQASNDKKDRLTDKGAEVELEVHKNKLNNLLKF